jgi:NAD(P)-dependent dehydrogenase (short-subunit alcohol dehydrogenase family)
VDREELGYRSRADQRRSVAGHEFYRRRDEKVRSHPGLQRVGLLHRHSRSGEEHESEQHRRTHRPHQRRVRTHRQLLPHMNVYAASKHAVTALTETLTTTIVSKIKVTVSEDEVGLSTDPLIRGFRSVSPGVVATEIDETSNIYLDEKTLEERKSRAALAASDCADAVIYALSTSPNCQVHDLIIKPIGEKF